MTERERERKERAGVTVGWKAMSHPRCLSIHHPHPRDLGRNIER